MALTFQSGDLDSADVQALLAFHFEQMRTTSPPDACHVLPIDGLRDAGVTFWSARDEGAGHDLIEVFGIDESLIERIEASADSVDLALVARKIEQSGRVAPR